MTVIETVEFVFLAFCSTTKYKGIVLTLTSDLMMLEVCICYSILKTLIIHLNILWVFSLPSKYWRELVWLIKAREFYGNVDFLLKNFCITFEQEMLVYYNKQLVSCRPV